MSERTTLASVDIDVAARTDSLDAGFRAATRKAETAAAGMAKAVRDGSTPSAGDMQAKGSQAAERLLAGLQATYQTEVSAAREQLFNGLIKPAEFEKRAKGAAVNFNNGLKEGLRDGARGDMAPEVRQKLIGEFKESGRQAGNGFMDRVKGAFLSWKTAIAGIVALVVRGFAKAYYEIGTGAEETASKFSTVFGRETAQAQAYLDEYARQLGLTNKAGQDLLATQAAIAQGMGMGRKASREFSEEVMRLAGDLSSFHNRTVEEVMGKLQSSMTGMHVPLKDLGIIITDTEVQARALAMTGKRLAGELTQADKAAATLALVTQKAGVAVGDLERTFGSTANTGRRVSAIFGQMKEDIAVGMVPVFGELLAIVEGNAGAFEWFGRTVKREMERIADVIVGVKILINEFNGWLLSIPHNTRASIAEGLGILGGWLDSAAELLNKIPGVNIESGLGARMRAHAATVKAETDRELAHIRAAVDEMNALDMARRLGAVGTGESALPDFSDDEAGAAAREAAAKAAEELARKQAALQERLLGELARLTADTTQEAIRQLGRFEAEWVEAFGRMDAATRAHFDRLRANIEAGGALDAFQRQLRDIGEMEPGAGMRDALDDVATAIRAAREDLEQGSIMWEQYGELLRRVEQQSQGLSIVALTGGLQAEYAREMARLRIDLARGVVDDKAFGEAGKHAARAFNAGILEVLAAGGHDEATVQALSGLLKGDAAGDDRAAKLREQARSIEENARAAVQFANAVGLVNSESAQALNTIISLAGGIARVAGGDLSALPGVLANAGSMLAQMFGGGGGKAAKERADILDRNTDALRQLTRELEGFRATANVIGNARDALAAATTQGLLADRSGIHRERYDDFHKLVATLQRFGMTLADLDDLAARYGIRIRDASGNLIAGGLRDLDAALAKAAQGLVGFRDTVDEQRAAAELEADIRNEASTATARLQRELALLAQFAPEMFAQFFAGIDTSTPEGRTAMREAMLALFEAFRDGTLELEGMTREEFLAVLRNIEGALDAGAGGVVSREQTRLSVSITEIQANELLRIQSTQLHYIAEYLPAIYRALGGTEALLAPGGATAGGPVDVRVDMAGMQITIHAAGAVGDADAMREGGRAAGEGFGEGFGQRLRAAWRGAGASNAARVPVDAGGGAR
jgi:hypothetical protein